MLPDEMHSLVVYIKSICLRSLCGLSGAIMSMITLPPISHGHIDYALFFKRAFVGAIFAVFAGPWVIELLSLKAPDLLLHKYPEFVYLMLGTIGYFIFRWEAIWLKRNHNRAINDVEFKRVKDEDNR